MAETVAEASGKLNDQYRVEIFNEDDGEEVKIGANRGSRIHEIIDEMYRDFAVERDPKDRLRCRNKAATDVFQFAQLTLDEYLERGNCPELKWNFAAETGGA
jgi:hypothetical protein